MRKRKWSPTGVSHIIALLLEVALIFPSEGVEKSLHKTNTEYFSTKAYLHFRYWVLMSHTLCATDLEGKQFFDARFKMPSKKKKRSVSNYFHQSCFELHAIFKNVECFSVSNFFMCTFQLIFNGSERRVNIVLTSYLRKIRTDMTCWKWWEE